MGQLASALDIRPGITAIIGSGGKTTLIYALAQELSRQGRVILSTSTKIFPPEGIRILPAPPEDGFCAPVCVALPCPGGKLTAPACSFDALADRADYVLMEADGSRGLPLKAHAPHEPVIPPNSNPVICVVGAAGFYRPADQVCHRPEIFARLAGMKLSDPVTPCHAARVIRAEGLAGRVFLNQVESSQDQAAARAFAAALGQPVIAGSLHKGVYSCL